MVQEGIKVSVIIPVRDEIAHIDACLRAVFSQKKTPPFEVIAIDSGSRDGSLERLKSYPRLRLLTITPENFGHGKTRNLGASEAGGEILVFLNADAIPQGNNWLYEMLEALHKDEGVVGVYSRHLARPECHLYMRRDLERSMPESSGGITTSPMSHYMLFSTVSAAVRRNIWQELPFNETIKIAEDQEWATRVLKAGYRISYESRSRVIHSHNYSAEQLYLVKKDVSSSYSRFSNRLSAALLGFFLALAGFKLKFWGDCLYIFRQPIKLKRRLEEIRIALKARYYSFAGRYRGWLSADYSRGNNGRKL